MCQVKDRISASYNKNCGKQDYSFCYKFNKKCAALLLFGWLYCNEYLKIGMSTESLTLAFHLLEAVLLMPGSCDTTSDKFYICGSRYF